MNTNLLFLFIIVLLFIPMFFNQRRQKRQAQEMQTLQNSITEGDVVVTTSGLRGTVVDSSYEETIDLEIAPGVVTTWIRAAVRDKVKPQADTTDAHPVDGLPAGSAAPASTDAAATPRPVESSSSAEPRPASEANSSASDTSSGRGGPFS
jgi:preprotein translocase subunit YajC